MSKSHLLIATTAALLVTAVGIPVAFAQATACIGSSLASSTQATYHGYSDNPAKPGAPGTSTAITKTSTVTAWNGDCTVLTRTTTVSKHYIDGPGKSDYSKHDSILSSTSCELDLVTFACK
jgi:hypothetical protein